MDIPAGGKTPQGRVRLFHGTTPENARKILVSGFAPELSKEGYYVAGGKSTRCIWFTTDIESARLYGGGAIIEVEAWPKDLDKLACSVGLGSNAGWDDVHCCQWDNKLAIVRAYLEVGSNHYGKVEYPKRA